MYLFVISNLSIFLDRSIDRSIDRYIHIYIYIDMCAIRENLKQNIYAMAPPGPAAPPAPPGAGGGAPPGPAARRSGSDGARLR